MSFSVDTNILIYSINKGSLHYPEAKKFVEEISSTPESWIFPWPIIHSFIRITTHSGILPHPLSSAQSISVIDDFLNLPNVRLVSETDLFWKVYKKELQDGHFRGSFVSDVVIASLLKEHGVSRFYTADRDFLRFKGIHSINPLEINAK